MGFFDEVKKKMDDINQTHGEAKVDKSPKKDKNLEKLNSKIKEELKKLLIDNEQLLDFYGTGFGFTGITNKRLLIGTNFASDTKPKKVISFIPLNKITAIEYEYEWNLILKEYNVNIQVSSKEYTVVFFTKADAISFHKILSKKILE